MIKTSEQWAIENYPSVDILDPDGWDRSNFHFSFYEEKITENEFLHRLSVSTQVIRTKDAIILR